MENCGPQVPGPIPFFLMLLLLLLLQPGTRSLPGHGSKNERQEWRQGTGEALSCGGGFDLYFILDKSSSVHHDWIYIFNFVDEIVKKIINPKLRMSFIIYATYGNTIMNLTSDRNEIDEGLKRLRKVKPSGSTFMQEGFKRAIEQMELSNAGALKNPTIILALTDGTLVREALQETVQLANKVRRMGATVYCVGVKSYKQEQLNVIADSKEHALGVKGGFTALSSVTDKLSKNSCVQIVSLEPSSVCAGEKYEVVVRGSGFYNARNKEDVLCSFKFSDANTVNENAVTVEENTITCPGPPLEKVGISVSVEVSLNKGLNFLSNNLSITSTECSEQTDSSDSPSLPSLPDIPNIPNIPDIPLLPVLVPSLLMLPVLLWCAWRLCCKPTVKELPPPPPQPPPPLPPPEKEEPQKEEKMTPTECPTVVFPCCRCPGVEKMRQMEWKLDTLCTLVNQSCIQLSPCDDRGWCINGAPGVKCQCKQIGCCCPRVCPSPCQERKCKPLTCCPSCHHPPPVHSQPPCRMLPLLLSRARSISGPPLALPPS